MIEINWEIFKTKEGLERYQQIENYSSENDNNICSKSKYDKKLTSGVKKMIENECAEGDLLNYIRDKLSFNTEMHSGKIHDDILIYIVKKLYINIIDAYIHYDVDSEHIIIKNICKYTDNIDFFMSYWDGSNNTINYYCHSLLYKNEPSQLSDFIYNNFSKVVKNPDAYYIFYIFDDVDIEIGYELIKHVIDKYKIKFGSAKPLKNKCSTPEKYIEIMEMLIINSLPKINHTLFMKEIMNNCNIDAVKYFTEKYFADINIIFELMKVVNKFEIFKYFINFVGVEKFDVDFFDTKFAPVHEYDILNWLYDNGFKININMMDFNSIDIIILIMQNMIQTNNYEHIRPNTEYITKKIFHELNPFEILNKIIKYVPLHMFDIDIIFKIAAMYNNVEIINLLLSNNFEPKNIQNIIHDAKLLGNTKILELF